MCKNSPEYEKKRLRWIGIKIYYRFSEIDKKSIGKEVCFLGRSFSVNLSGLKNIKDHSMSKKK